jgi:hypothetical protein
MKKGTFIIKVVLLPIFLIFLIGQNVVAAPERPSDADLMAFKVYHHAVYMVTTAKQAILACSVQLTAESLTATTLNIVQPLW